MTEGLTNCRNVPVQKEKVKKNAEGFYNGGPQQNNFGQCDEVQKRGMHTQGKNQKLLQIGIDLG